MDGGNLAGHQVIDSKIMEKKLSSYEANIDTVSI